jgi:hypothetical protein
MRNLQSGISELRELVVRRCDTIFYSTLAIFAVLTAISDYREGQFNIFVYRCVVNAIFYREVLRLVLWSQENHRYAAASLFGVFAGAVSFILLKHPESFLYEVTVYLALRALATMLFGLTEKEVFKLYVDVLFDYYNRNATPPKPPSGTRRKKLKEALAAFRA